MNSSVRDILTAVFQKSGLKLNADNVLKEYSDIKIFKKHIPAWFTREDGIAYVSFEYDGEIYRTALRGKHQAVNAAYCIEVVKRINNPAITREHIDDALVDIPFNGRFETLNSKPFILFDIVEMEDDAKNFVECVHDYFGRSVQASMISDTNLHPTPFKKLIIADIFFPELIKIKQNVTIIFTKQEFCDQYIHTYNGVVKTHVMKFNDAVAYAVKNFPDYKILIIGGRSLYEKTKEGVGKSCP